MDVSEEWLTDDSGEYGSIHVISNRVLQQTSEKDTFISSGWIVVLCAGCRQPLVIMELGNASQLNAAESQRAVDFQEKRSLSIQGDTKLASGLSLCNTGKKRSAGT